MFSIHGNPELPEQELKHWEGYKKSSPVRIGNAAYKQYQSDIYGELMDSLYLYNKYVLPIPYDFWTGIQQGLDWVCGNWQTQAGGVWGGGSSMEHFGYSRLGMWGGVDEGEVCAGVR